MAIQIKLRQCYNPQILKVDQLLDSGKNAFVDSNGHLYFIGKDSLYCVKTGKNFIFSETVFTVEYFCDVSIILDKVE